jgi:hypothetical protein
VDAGLALARVRKPLSLDTLRAVEVNGSMDTTPWLPSSRRSAVTPGLGTADWRAARVASTFAALGSCRES